MAMLGKAGHTLEDFKAWIEACRKLYFVQKILYCVVSSQLLNCSWSVTEFSRTQIINIKHVFLYVFLL